MRGDPINWEPQICRAYQVPAPLSARQFLEFMLTRPLQFKPGENAASLGLNGEEVYAISGIVDGLKANFAGASRELGVTAARTDGTAVQFRALSRIDTPQEVLYYQHGGILPYVLRQLLAAS